MRKRNRTKSNRPVRHLRIRKSVIGTPDRPRLCASPSLQHFEAQIIDDSQQMTLAGFSTKAKEFKKLTGVKSTGNVKAAEIFGKFVARKAKEKGIAKIVFDRSGYLYHGRIKAFAQGAREEGLQF